MSFDTGTAGLAQTSMVTGGIGALTSAIGAYTGGQATAQATNYQAAIARNNQTVAEQNAQYDITSGNAQEQAQRQKTAQIIGMQRSGMAANGVDIGSGTPARIQESQAATGELDALTIRNNAARQAYNYRTQA